ncbi:Type II/IV secretion system protein TadC, associated with Flp pilus assembly [Chondromyces apiculatus DSM 436]|uniref:Type II/IV secretion system protein TadC, associated with Flp pilus assembly n=2 Tax=Chondromyces apiculatus TaxID=51 RepID=A0A017TDC9_9BACT|nr:Type II/IV secretion system protein TadC, associated with Flp pilus assembly [Chondromyces apiculatus DSM 436]
MLNYLVFRYLFLVCVAVALGLAVYTVASAPTRVASRLGMRGLKRRWAIEANAGWASLEPVVRWLGVRVSGMVGDTTRARVDAMIALAGDYLGLTPDEFFSLSLLSSVLGGVFGAVVAVLIDGSIGAFALLGLMFGAMLPYFQTSGESTRRLRLINEGLPYVIDLMALAMSAGLDFPGAIRQVVEKSSNPDDPLLVEFKRILQEMQLGRTRKQVLSDFCSRAPTGPVTEFVSALIQAEERGNPVADVLQIQAGVSRLRRSVRAEEAAAKAAVKMIGPLFLLFACIMMLVMGPMVLTLMEQ